MFRFHRHLLPLVLASGLLVLTPGCQSSGSNPPSKSSSAAPASQTATTALARYGDGQGVDSIADTVETVLPSVVSVASTRIRKEQVSPFHYFFGQPPREQKQEGLGSGVILSSDGIIVTNNHVVEDADKLRVRTFDDREYEAKVVGTDPKSDLAVLQLTGEFSDLVPIKVGDSSQLRLGEVVLAIGNPFGVGQTVTMGIVSAKGRADMGIVDYEDFIQTDAAINPGNSGGALVNSRGELVGINTAILSRSGGYMGIGFAIPTNMAGPIVDALRTEGRVDRGWLGVSIQDLTPDLALALSLGKEDGVLIAEVSEGSPAAKAGLESGDVVVGVDGTEVESTGRFRNLIAAKGKGKEVKLAVVRGKKRLAIKVTLGALPGDEEDKAPISSGEKKGPEIDGLTLGDLDDNLRRRVGAPEGLEGVVVLRVRPGSKADQAKLRPGDVILSVNHEPVGTAAELSQLYQKAQGAKLLHVFRQGHRSYVAIR